MEALVVAVHDEAVAASVVDLGNGCYSAHFTVKRAGAWTLRPRVSFLGSQDNPRLNEQISFCKTRWVKKPDLLLSAWAPQSLTRQLLKSDKEQPSEF